jgi:hypothetical protein
MHPMGKDGEKKVVQVGSGSQKGAVSLTSGKPATVVVKREIFIFSL